MFFKYCTNKSENLHGGISHQKVVRASAKLKNPISHFQVIKCSMVTHTSLGVGMAQCKVLIGESPHERLRSRGRSEHHNDSRSPSWGPIVHNSLVLIQSVSGHISHY